MPRTTKELPPESSPVLTVKQVAAYLNVERRTVLKMLNEGKLKGAKIGSDWRILKTEVDRLLAGGEAKEG